MRDHAPRKGRGRPSDDEPTVVPLRPAVIPLLRAALPAACATTLEAVFALRVGRSVDLVRLAEALGIDAAAALDALAEAENAFAAVFEVRLMPPHRPWFADRDEAAREDADAVAGEVLLSAGVVGILERAPAALPAAEDVPGVDGATAAWVSALGAGRSHDDGAVHLALRTGREPARAAADLAGLLQAMGVHAFWIDPQRGELAAELLRVELHRRASPGVVIVASGLLADVDTAWNDLSEGVEEAEEASAFALGAKWLGAMATPCIWCVPRDRTVPGSLAGLVAGAIGPIRPQAGWGHAKVREAVGGGVGDAGVAAIAATLDDPRDAPARGRAVRLLAATGMQVDAACRFVASSLVASPPPRAVSPVDFDPELVSHDPEIALLLARAPEIAKAGGRILLTGKVGGGKSNLLSAMAARMEAAGAAGPAIHVTAGRILVRAYGGTERILDRLWSEAALGRSPLVIDEIDALCGVRDQSASSGNAYLVRVLTDEFLRLFDAHPQVVVLASCNERSSVDPGVLRRFHVEHFVADELPPHLERRAWTTLLGMEPSPRWTPCGAAPSDFTAARVRCRMLGLYEPLSLARAVERAADLRRGAKPAVTAKRLVGPVH